MSHNQKFKFSVSGNGNGAGDRIKYDTKKRKTVKSKNENQQRYIDAIDKCDIIFCLGPAGSGKTHVASGMAAKLYLGDEISKVKVVRPAIEVGHSLGFLPGDLDDKIHPYLRPVLEELQEFLGPEELKKMRQGEFPILEFSTLQYMRGSNFKDSFVIMDEAQNATFKEMKMFLTRLSYGSKLVINGDPSQSDLHPQEQGALEHFANLYADFDEVAVIYMTEADSVRHPLVTKMLKRDKERNVS